ncbi:MAG TPA: papain-like cysteine protease family protein [Kofleriaceae bacterium]|nr:papain-like cysteine protease family protein [Kofleriaceae bacterium]
MLGTDDVVTQERAFWCWAAVVQMLRRHFGLEARRQCDIVGARLARDCCQVPMPAPCNVPHHMDSFDRLLGSEGISSRGGVLQGPLDERTLSNELHSDRPVVIGWIWDKSGGHFVLAFGRPRAGKKKPKKRFYLVADPLEGPRSITYERLRNPDGGTWSWSWYNLKAS